MPHQNLTVRRKVATELFGQIDRAMLAAGTTDGDGNVTALVAIKFGNPAFEKTDDMGQVFADGFLALQKKSMTRRSLPVSGRSTGS